MPMSPQNSQLRFSLGILFVRILVGWVFLSEGIQKLLFPAALGAGRFLKIGIPAPAFTGPFVGAVEIVCGTPTLYYSCDRAVIHRHCAFSIISRESPAEKALKRSP